MFEYEESVDVRISVENTVSCPRTTTYAYLFEIRHLDNRELSASITAVDNSVYLSASITVDSNAFFYNKVFNVVIEAKDFSGNEMEPFTFQFKIQDGS
jgi:hypothetical protein